MHLTDFIYADFFLLSFLNTNKSYSLCVYILCKHVIVAHNINIKIKKYFKYFFTFMYYDYYTIDKKLASSLLTITSLTGALSSAKRLGVQALDNKYVNNSRPAVNEKLKVVR